MLCRGTSISTTVNNAVEKLGTTHTHTQALKKHLASVFKAVDNPGIFGTHCVLPK